MKKEGFKRLFCAKAGFTLIELLVVVLIIGILAAVALPQYNKASTKSKYASLKHMTEALYQAQQSYYLTNGVYAGDFRELDIEIGNVTQNILSFKGGSCQKNINETYISESYVYCKHDKSNLAYLKYLKSGNRYCIIYGGDPLATQICKEETHDENPSSSSWYAYH